MKRFPQVRTLIAAGGLLVGLAAPVHAQTGIDAARTAFRQGDYDTALASLRRLTSSNEAPWPATELHARVLAEVGRYEDALALIEAFEGPDRLELSTAQGEILLALGRWSEAERAFASATRAQTQSRHLAAVRTGEIWALQGRSADAESMFDGFIDVYNGSAPLSGEDLLAVGTAVAHLGRSSSVLFQDALRAFDEAAAAVTGDPRPTLAVGELFLLKYISPEAHEAFQAVLAANPDHPDALLGEARALAFDGDGSAVTVARKALEANPNHVGARTFLAQQHLRAEDFGAARVEAEAGLAVNARSLETLSVLAAAQYLSGDLAGYRATRDRTLSLNPSYPGLFNTVAELAVDHRKYEDAVDLAREAVQRDSLSWRGWGLLGINRLRTGEMEQGRADLERAFAGDPYNPWYKNTLDLLDSMVEYETLETEHFELVIRGDEAELLGPVAAGLAEEAYAALSARYRSEPPTPIRLELFPLHADFSVRTLGLVGLGALGVSFGSTLVMDSPSAREAGDFNWASTLWHELAHAFHLAMTDHNVPRWFSEGLAVREQRVARPYWGHKASLPFLQAYRAGDLHPVSELNEGFVRPSFPGEVVLSYFQASLVFDWMEERFDFDAVRAFLDGYRRGETTPGLMREVLGLTPDAVDAAFDDYVRARFEVELSATAANPMSSGSLGLASRGSDPRDLDDLRDAARRSPGDFVVRLTLGRALVAEGQLDEADGHLREALRLFPQHGQPEGALRYLARIHQARGEPGAAADLLRTLGGQGESLHEVHLEEASLRRALGDADGERRALARALEIFPYDLDHHERVAELAGTAGDIDAVVGSRRAILALDPVDRADAHYRLATALRDAGHAGEARTQVLRALEIAPGFEAALDLLLDLRGGVS